MVDTSIFNPYDFFLTVVKVLKEKEPELYLESEIETKTWNVIDLYGLASGGVLESTFINNARNFLDFVSAKAPNVMEDPRVQKYVTDLEFKDIVTDDGDSNRPENKEQDS